MAEAVVTFVLRRLGQLLIEEGKFLYKVSDEIEQIRAKLRRMKCFLRDADSRQEASGNETIRNWVIEIREAGYDVEDVVETYVFKIASDGRRRRTRRRRIRFRIILRRYACSVSRAIKLHNIGLETKTIMDKITDLTTNLETHGVKAISGEDQGRANSYGRVMSTKIHLEEEFVGLEDELAKLVTELANEASQSRVISIYGMGGLGKTTVAKKLYKNNEVRQHFDSFAWARITQRWQKKDVLEGILIKLMPEEKREDIMRLREEELVEELFNVQKKKRCLIVLDNMWYKEDWDKLSGAFPISSMRGKILLTTRKKEVASYVDKKGFQYKPRLLNEEESWKLLQMTALAERDIKDLGDERRVKKLGMELVEHCGGLPLGVVVLGGLLDSKNTLPDWEAVQTNLNRFLMRGTDIGQNSPGRVANVLAESYNDLPCELKPCFLYLGNFSGNIEVDVEELYHMWIAEGMVSSDEKLSNEPMMEVAERYLRELAQRSMIEVQVEETTKRLVSCRLHDLMREFCLLKAEKENFLKITDFQTPTEEGYFPLSLGHKTRRLAMYLGKDLGTFVPLEKNITKHLRSALCFAPNLHVPKMKSIMRGFVVLRVLILVGFVFRRLPKTVGKLIHLRYLSLRNCAIKVFPSSIGNLIYLQTLDLRVAFYQSPRRVIIPDVLWRLERLVHLYLPCYDIGRGQKLRLDGLSKLETLENFDSRGNYVRDLFEMKHLRKFKASVYCKHQDDDDLKGIVSYLNGNSSTLLQHCSVSIYEWDIQMEEELEILRQILACSRLHVLLIKGSIRELPVYSHNFSSSSLTSLTLQGCQLEEDPMSTLEKFPCLRQLFLGLNSFVGKEMVCSENGFPQLSNLTLWGLFFLEKWTVNEGALCKLSHLEILNCKKLEMIPEGMKFVSSLQELEIRDMPQHFQNRLRVIDGEEGKDLYKVRHVPKVMFW